MGRSGIRYFIRRSLLDTSFCCRRIFFDGTATRKCNPSLPCLILGKVISRLKKDIELLDDELSHHRKPFLGGVLSIIETDGRT